MRIPSAIVLDMHPAVKNLQDRILFDVGVVDSEADAVYYTDKLIEDIVTCLDRENMAMSSIELYAASQRRYLEEEGKDAEAVRVATQIVKFGIDLLSEFKQYGVYQNGELNYTYTGRCGVKTLILSRYT